jgi:phosphoribosylformylglycinamidine cyclo-ligase
MNGRDSNDLYKDAGVDTATGDAVVSWLQSEKTQFQHPRGLGSVRDGIGGFAGIFSFEFSHLKSPALVASTDGVGTKLLLGLDSKRTSHLGQDLVAMCVNDLYTVGAAPLFFLDYYATGALNPDQFKDVLSSIKDSCRTCGMALLGGETAEMPGLYEKGHFDLAGFVVGVVDETRRLGPERVRVGDVLIAFKSTGFHSNGYSLIRRWLKASPRSDLHEALMTPTKLYNEIPELLTQYPQSLHALAHITGGGISGNLPRVLPANTVAAIYPQAIPTPSWMIDFIRSNGATTAEVEPVFNLGCGMIAVVDPQDAASLTVSASQLGLSATEIGQVVAGEGPAFVRYL